MLQQTRDVRTCDVGEAELAAKNALWPSLKSDWCVCMPLPLMPNTGLGMNVACTPWSMAICLTTSRYVITLSAMVRASV